MFGLSGDVGVAVVVFPDATEASQPGGGAKCISVDAGWYAGVSGQYCYTGADPVNDPGLVGWSFGLSASWFASAGTYPTNTMTQDDLARAFQDAIRRTFGWKRVGGAGKLKKGRGVFGLLCE